MLVGNININLEVVKKMSKKEFIKMFGDRIDNASKLFDKIKPQKKEDVK